MNSIKNKQNKAIFFDRDGVVNYRIVKDYVKTPADFHFIPDFFDFFSAVKSAGYIAILITNQQGIGKGFMTDNNLSVIHSYMQDALRSKTGFEFDDIYYCPDLADTLSFRRKPNPGMIEEAVERWNIDRACSWMIGDRRSDVQAGIAASLRTILIAYHDSDYCPQAHFNFLSLSRTLEFFRDSELA